jgi:hypothetical protein
VQFCFRSRKEETKKECGSLKVAAQVTKEQTELADVTFEEKNGHINNFFLKTFLSLRIHIFVSIFLF